MAETPRASGPLATLNQTLRQGRELIAGIADVAALEGRLAVQSVAQMLALAVGSALLACSAWGLLLAALAFALARAGVPWLWLLPAMALVNGLLTWWAVLRLRALAGDLGFNATRELLHTLPATLTEQQPEQRTRQEDEHHEKPPAAAP